MLIFWSVVDVSQVFTVPQAAVRPSAKTSAGLNTVCLAFACFSGGYRCRRNGRGV